jgi:hypothetical protein
MGGDGESPRDCADAWGFPKLADTTYFREQKQVLVFRQNARSFRLIVIKIEICQQITTKLSTIKYRLINICSTILKETYGRTGGETDVIKLADSFP